MVVQFHNVGPMLFVCLLGDIERIGSWNLMIQRDTKHNLRRKGCLVMSVSRHCPDLTWITCSLSSHNVLLAWLFPMEWWSKHWFWFVLINHTYQPWHKRRSLPRCGPFLASSNISPDNMVNTRYCGQCSEKDPFATSGGHIWQNDEAFHMTTSPGEWRKEWHGVRKGPRIGSVVQLTIQNAAYGRETTGNALFKQQWEREITRGICGARDSSGKNVSSRCSDSDDARAGPYGQRWKGMIDNHKAWNNIRGDVEWYQRQ
jgi:hypothetical protein